MRYEKREVDTLTWQPQSGGQHEGEVGDGGQDLGDEGLAGLLWGQLQHGAQQGVGSGSLRSRHGLHLKVEQQAVERVRSRLWCSSRGGAAGGPLEQTKVHTP